MSGALRAQAGQKHLPQRLKPASPPLPLSLTLRNHQRVLSVDLRLLRQIAVALLRELLAIREVDLTVRLVEAAEITRFNETFLHHTGVTDVITFDYSSSRAAQAIQGDILICPSEAARQAKQFRTNWQTELVRYVVHGVLHLQGYDDLNPAKRREMKKEENRLVRELGRRFALRGLAKKR